MMKKFLIVLLSVLFLSTAFGDDWEPPGAGLFHGNRTVACDQPYNESLNWTGQVEYHSICPCLALLIVWILVMLFVVGSVFYSLKLSGTYAYLYRIMILGFDFVVSILMPRQTIALNACYSYGGQIEIFRIVGQLLYPWSALVLGLLAIQVVYMFSGRKTGV